MSANEAVLTFDIDWAPDFMLDPIINALISAKVRSTWFVTHQTPAVDRMRLLPDLFELGVHPNFLAGSSHGSTPEQVLSTVTSIVPEAISTRSHGVAQSGPILAAIARSASLEIECSTFLPGVGGIEPFYQYVGGGVLTRIPYLWADDHEMQVPNADWDAAQILAIDGLKVFDFHPMHVFLNSPTAATYEQIRETRRNLTAESPEAIAEFVNEGVGPGTMLSQLISHLAGATSFTLRELRDCWTGSDK